MRFSLRTLIVVMLLGGPVLAGMWWGREVLLGLTLLVLAVGALTLLFMRSVDAFANARPLLPQSRWSRSALLAVLVLWLLLCWLSLPSVH
jgi:hypothetical protein